MTAKTDSIHFAENTTLPVRMAAMETLSRPQSPDEELPLKTGMAVQLQAEEALRDSETRYRRLFETAKDGILILDADTG